METDKPDKTEGVQQEIGRRGARELPCPARVIRRPREGRRMEACFSEEGGPLVAGMSVVVARVSTTVSKRFPFRAQGTLKAMSRKGSRGIVSLLGDTAPSPLLWRRAGQKHPGYFVWVSPSKMCLKVHHAALARPYSSVHFFCGTRLGMSDSELR